MTGTAVHPKEGLTTCSRITTLRLCLAEETGVLASAPKEQPPRKLSGKTDCKTVDTLESGRILSGPPKRKRREDPSVGRHVPNLSGSMTEGARAGDLAPAYVL